MSAIVINKMNSSANLPFPAKRLGKHASGGMLTFEPDGLVFYPTSNASPELRIASHEVTNFAVRTHDTRKEEVNPYSVYFFGLLAFLFPQKSGALSIEITVQTAREQVRFSVDEETIADIRPKIDYYLDEWRVIPN